MGTFDKRTELPEYIASVRTRIRWAKIRVDRSPMTSARLNLIDRTFHSDEMMRIPEIRRMMTRSTFDVILDLDRSEYRDTRDISRAISDIKYAISQLVE